MRAHMMVCWRRSSASTLAWALVSALASGIACEGAEGMGEATVEPALDLPPDLRTAGGRGLVVDGSYGAADCGVADWLMDDPLLNLESANCVSARQTCLALTGMSQRANGR